MQLVFPVANEHEQLLPDQNRVLTSRYVLSMFLVSCATLWVATSKQSNRTTFLPPTHTSTSPLHTRAHATHCSTTQAKK